MTENLEPLSEEEEKSRQKVAKNIEEAGQRNEPEAVSKMRREIADAARLGIISKKDAIDTSLPPARRKKVKK
jgi:hypothetical protein